MKRASLTLKTLVVICLLSFLPASMAIAASPSKKASVKQGTTGALIDSNDLKSKSTVSPLTTNVGNGGSITVTAYDMGLNTMEAEWALVSTTEPITYVNVTTTYDDGYSVRHRYSTPLLYTVGNSSQHVFGNAGYHSATVTGWGYKDYIFSFTIIPTTDGTTITY